MLNLFPTIFALTVSFLDIGLIYLVRAFVTRKKWESNKRLNPRIAMMKNTTFSAFYLSISSFGFDVTFKYFLINNLVESFFSYLTNLFLVILGVSIAEIIYENISFNR